MAKKRLIRGYDINTIDVNAIPPSEFKKIVQQMVNTENRNINRLISSPAGENSPLAFRIKERKDYKEGEFYQYYTLKGLDAVKDRRKIKNIFSAIMANREKPSHTISGWRKIEKNIVKRLGYVPDSKWWQVYRRLEEQGMLSNFGYDSDSAQRFLRDNYNPDDSIDENILQMADRLENLYEETEEEYSEFEEFSGEFSRF